MKLKKQIITCNKCGEKLAIGRQLPTRIVGVCEKFVENRFLSACYSEILRVSISVKLVKFWKLRHKGCFEVTK